ncbi:MAG: sulfatase [Fidelibacterota bacterium]|nr:MAG: sulfatase [Candidatus Neomarinimicrobiota bacterium]
MIPGGKKKNILFIAVDDLRPQLGCYGNSEVISPHIDDLARSGLLFKRAYCQQAICSPSRISLLTGLRCESTRIYGLEHRKKDYLPDIISLPQHFRNNGYETVSIGKVYHHSDDDPTAWSRGSFRAMKGSGYVTDDAMTLVEENRRTNPNAGTKGPATEAADVADNVYSDGKLADRAIEEIRMLKDKPFFLALGFRKPHLPFTAPKRYWDLYNPDAFELADNPFPPMGATPYTMNNYGELRNYYGMPRGKKRVEDDLARHLIHGYHACVSFIDAQIGRVVAELEAQGLRDRTIIVLWGDHGWKLGEHDSWCKHTNFEIDTNAPLLISAPGMANLGQSTEALTEFVDIYPTLCELTGLPKPDHLEGISFTPLMENPHIDWKKAAFSIWVAQKYRYDEEIQVIGFTMKTDRYRYTEWKHTRTGEVRARELYDHRIDPDENINAIDDPEYAAIVPQLEAQMAQGWRAALPDSIE